MSHQRPDDSRILTLRRQRGAEFGRLVETNIAAGKLGDFALIPFNSGRLSRCTLGNRVCRIEVNCGLGNKKLLSALDEATLPHLVAWDNMEARPVSYINGRYVAIEAPWESWLQRSDIQLLSVADNILSSDRFVVGPNENGTVITLYMADMVHLLIGGETGSGKSWTLRSAAYQLAGPRNRLVLLDGKFGEGLGICDGLQGQVGPLATTRQSIVNALGWCFKEMKSRYITIANGGGFKFYDGDRGTPPHLIILFDEFQEFTEGGKDKTIVEALRKLATQGRAARIHLWLGTQKPLQSMFGKTATRDQFGAAIGGKVRGYSASEAIMGGNEPRCDALLLRGDAYVKAATSHGLLVERVQVAYVPERDLKDRADYRPDLEDWPLFDESELDIEIARPGRKADCLNPDEVAVGVAAALEDRGVPWIRDRIDEIPNRRRPGSDKGKRIQNFGHAVLSRLNAMNSIPDDGLTSLPEL